MEGLDEVRSAMEGLRFGCHGDGWSYFSVVRVLFLQGCGSSFKRLNGSLVIRSFFKHSINVV